MAYQFTARFDRLSAAESAAAKLKSIRAHEVEISPWSGGSGDGEYALSGRAGFPAPTGLAFPAFGAMGGGMSGGNVSGAGFPIMAAAAPDETLGDQGYLLHAVVDDDRQEQGRRIVSECGGSEI